MGLLKTEQICIDDSMTIEPNDTIEEKEKKLIESLKIKEEVETKGDRLKVLHNIKSYLLNETINERFLNEIESIIVDYCKDNDTTDSKNYLNEKYEEINFWRQNVKSKAVECLLNLSTHKNIDKHKEIKESSENNNLVVKAKIAFGLKLIYNIDIQLCYELANKFPLDNWLLRYCLIDYLCFLYTIKSETNTLFLIIKSILAYHPQDRRHITTTIQHITDIIV